MYYFLVNQINIYNVIEIAPEISLAHVIKRLQPEVLRYIRLFAMTGSIHRGYKNSSRPSIEYNIVVDISAAHTVFSAPWTYFGLAPLDTTIFAQFDGSLWQLFLSYGNQSKHVQLVIDSYTVWYNNGGKRVAALKPFSPEIGTSTMYDVLAAVLASSYPVAESVVSVGLPLIVTDIGFTSEDSKKGKIVNSTLDFITSDPYASIEVIGKTVLDSIIFSK